MRLTILGSAASFAGAGQACAGHLVEGGGATVLFDCGNGVLANLQLVQEGPVRLDAVFVTHNHPDHYADLYCLNSALRYDPDGPLPPMPLYMPEGLFERVQCILSERGASEFREAFDARVLRDGEPVTIGGLTVTPHAVDHTPPTFGLVADADDERIAYTADTSPGDHALTVARDADILIAEATLPEQFAGSAPHMTASEAGALAREAGAGALVLVHVWPTNDREAMGQAAADAFGEGPVYIAEELEVFDISEEEE